jgi:hypothetical protein
LNFSGNARARPEISAQAHGSRSLNIRGIRSCLSGYCESINGFFGDSISPAARQFLILMRVLSRFANARSLFRTIFHGDFA